MRSCLCLCSVNAQLCDFQRREASISQASILRPRPCRRPLWQLRSSWLLAWWLRNNLIGLLVCWVFVVWFLFCYPSLLECVLARWFHDVRLHATFLALPVASLQPSAIAHCFNFGFCPVWWLAGLLRFVWRLIFVLLNLSAEMYAGSPASGC